MALTRRHHFVAAAELKLLFERSPDFHLEKIPEKTVPKCLSAQLVALK